MNRRIFLTAFSIALMFISVHAQLPAKARFSDQQGSGINLQKNHRDSDRRLNEPTSGKWNDSIHSYNWRSSASDWTPSVREFLSRSPYGNVASRFYLSLDTVTNQWEKKWLDQLEYFGSTGDLKMKSYQQWDSVSSAWSEYYYEHYSSPGHLEEYFSKNWNTVTRRFDSGNRTTYQYNLSGSTTEDTGQSLDTLTQEWKNSYQLLYTYNTASLLDSYISRMWEPTLIDWVNNGKTEYSYDSSNLLTETRQYYWDSSTWNFVRHSVFTNNSAGRPLEQLDENPDGAAWDTVSRVQFTYDASDTNITVRLEQNYNSHTHTWINVTRTTNSYFTNGKQNSTLYQLWNTLTLSWMNCMSTEYDMAGNYTDSYYIAIDGLSFQVYYGTRYHETYDENERFLMELHQVYDTAAGGTWVDKSRVQDTYEDPVNAYYIEELGTIWNGTDWVNDYKDDFFWSYPSSIGNIRTPERLCFYENPMAEGKPIYCPLLDRSETYQFDVISMKGENVYNNTVTGSNTFTLNRYLTPGQYILRISANGKTVYCDKIVIID